MKEIFPRITVDTAVQFGKPVITGTRVPVEVIVENIAGGMAIDDVMEEYRLMREDVLAALRYASKVLAEETVMAR